jgi:GT2 family glycosyltransferase
MQSLPENCRKTLIKELTYEHTSKNVQKDIVIVVRNQYDSIAHCLESIKKNTTNYRLFIWDNASDTETQELLKSYNPHCLRRSDTNLGFIEPNNQLVALTSSPIIVLLNSDVHVRLGWDNALVGALSHYDIVGYEGSLLDENGKGFYPAWGDEIDYVSGWCLAFSRQLYDHIGLFDNQHLKFAYCEDSDFCLRAKSAGYKVYALHLDYAFHEGSKTIKAVQYEQDVTETFHQNHEYMRLKWSHYLMNDRVLTKKNYGKT